MEDSEKIIKVAEALGTKLQEKFENDPFAYVYPDIMEAFMEVIKIKHESTIKTIKES